MQDASLLARFLRSTLGMKVLMAVTGVVLFGFLIGHVAGNLLVFAGPAKMDEYARFLKANLGLLWGVRLTLLASVVVHIAAAIRLTKLKADARPVGYASKRPHGSSFASRTMMWSGPVIALFVVYHLLHFTTGHAHHSYPAFAAEKVYDNVVTAFSRPLVSAVYLAAMLAVGLHLAHGVWSMLQTVGLNRPHLEPALRGAAVVLAVLIIGGFIAIPLGVLTGIVGGGAQP
ncbi:MAG TPA: succinate dehydrogenase cytochrome b subunit [Planctomycetota bacterium]|nr:succinate dehydrogenase cytochrome b subunit [Planctomycetota bacterium]